MKNKIKLTILLGISISLIACKTRQTMLTAAVSDAVPPTETERITDNSDSLKNNKLTYDWISYRANANITTPKETNSVNVFVVNRRDSIIYINASKFGIEGARLVLTPDSVKFINHLNSTYYVGDYDIAEQFVGLKINFYLLQSLLIGEELPENVKLPITASYGNFTTIDSQLFFQQADFIIPEENLQLNLQLKNIKLNEVGPTSIRIPEKYKPIK